MAAMRILTLGILVVPGVSALKLATLMADHMVLPREPLKAKVWGTAAPGSKVQVTLDHGNGKTYKGQANAEGSWSVELEPEPAMTGKNLNIEGDGDTITLTDVAFGDVFVCLGQSNMRFGLEGAFDYDEVKATGSEYPNLRMVELQPAQCSKPQSEIHTEKGKDATCVVDTGGYYLWASPTQDPVWWKGMSAVCYNFGINVYKELDGKVPIGLVAGFRDNTEIQQFMSPKALADKTCGGLGEVAHSTELLAKRTGLEKWLEKVDSAFESTDSLTFNGIIHPLLNLRPAGVLWYQGEANREQSTEYQCWFPSMITDMREKFSVPDMDFYFVQLAAHAMDESFADMRMAQLRAVELPNVGYAVAIDQGDVLAPGSSLHPRRKAEIGRRLAMRALYMHYGATDKGQGPVAEEAVRDDKGHVQVAFEDGTADGLHYADAPDCNLTGSKKCCKESPFEAKVGEKWQRVEDWQIRGKWVLLRDVGAAATSVRFDWHTFPQCVMLNGDGGPDDHTGIAASPFDLKISSSDVTHDKAIALRGVRRHA